MGWRGLKRKAAFRRPSCARCGTFTICDCYRRTRRDATALRFVLLSIVGTTSSSIRMADLRQAYPCGNTCAKLVSHGIIRVSIVRNGHPATRIIGSQDSHPRQVQFTKPSQRLFSNGQPPLHHPSGLFLLILPMVQIHDSWVEFIFLLSAFNSLFSALVSLPGTGVFSSLVVKWVMSRLLHRRPL